MESIRYDMSCNSSSGVSRRQSNANLQHSGWAYVVDTHGIGVFYVSLDADEYRIVSCYLQLSMSRASMPTGEM